MRSFESFTTGRRRACSAASGSPAAGSITLDKLTDSDTFGATSQLLHTSPVREILPRVMVPSFTPFLLKVAWKARMNGTPRITIGPMLVSSSKSVMAGTQMPEPKPSESEPAS